MIDFEPELAKLLEPWVRRARALTLRKVEDAAAHASRAITETLRRTPDGRQTLRAARSSRSFQAAVNRLDELKRALIGPASNSLEGLLRDAREAFLKDAYRLWSGHLDPDYFDAPGEPSPGEVAMARGAVIHGRSLHDELGGRFDSARRALLGVVTLAANPRVTPMGARAQIAGWESAAISSLSAALGSALSDSQIAIFYSVPVAFQKES